MIVGRELELERVATFVADVACWPAAAVLEGQAGIGKSTLWRVGVEAARERGHRLLVCRPSASDATLSFTGLGDLLDGAADGSFDALPPRQRQAVDAALLRGADDAPDPDWRAVSIGVVGLLRNSAERQPLVIAIDDVQWLDPSSLRVLTFAVRRLADAAVGLLVASRTPAGDAAVSALIAPFTEDTMTRIGVEGLPVDALGRILRDRLGEGLDRADVRHIHEQSRGNPFYALEMGRAVLTREPLATGRTIPIPRSLLDDFVRHRLGALSEDARETMLAVAAAFRPTVAFLTDALEDRDVGSGLDEARRAGILEISHGVVSFTHPLYGSAIYEHGSRAHRRELHAHLAFFADGVEERARHLALALDGPDRNGAEVLERAAARSAARGAPDAAASLLLLSVRATPPEDVGPLVRRYLAMAASRFQIGDTDGAIADAASAVDRARPGVERADARRLLARFRTYADDHTEAQAVLESALDEPDLDDVRRAGLHADLFWVLHNLGAFEPSRIQAREALRLQREAGGSDLASGIAATARVFRLDLGPDLTPEDFGTSRMPGEPDDTPMRDWPAVAEAEELVYVGRHHDAVATLHRLLAISGARGDEPGRARILWLLAELERRLGHLPTAQAHAEAARELVEQLGFNAAMETALLASILATRGREPAARAMFDRAMALGRSGSASARLLTSGHLGAFELSLGHLEEADRSLAHAAAILFDAGVGEPGAFPFVHDAAEAAIALGQLDAAEPLVEWLEERGEELDRAYAISTGARCRGLLREAQGDRPSAVGSFERALAEGGRDPMPLELARTHLALGSLRRRDGEKRSARASLEAAAALFDDIGATVWSGRARAELTHIAGRRPSAGILTDAEDRVARLAAAGRRNREIADTLVMSVRTVESHLSHVYAKLEIRSRTELAIFYGSATDAAAGSPPTT